MSPLAANDRTKPLGRAATAWGALACLLVGLLQAAPSHAAVGAGPLGQPSAGAAAIPIQATTEDVYRQSPDRGEVYEGDGGQPDGDQQEPTKRKRSTSPRIQFQVPTILFGKPRTQEPALVEVPDLLGRAPEDAARLLAQRKLTLRQGRLLDGTAETGERIVAQDPAAGARVAPGAPVTVDIELPPPLFPVPAIVGMTLQQAIAAVTGGGFSFEARRPADTGARRDRIAAQQPAAGSLHPPGTVVVGQMEGAPVKAVAPPPLPGRKPLVAVPDLAGLSRDQAAGRLGEARLRLAGPSADELRDPAAVVTRQSPAAGTEVPLGTQVAVILLAPPAAQPGAGQTAPQDAAPDAPPETPQAQAPLQPPAEPPADGTEQAPRSALERQGPARDAVLALTARDLWWTAGGAALVLLLLLALWRLLRARGAAPARLPVVSYLVERDPGAQRIAWDSEPGLRCRLQVRTIADPGTQLFVVEQDVAADAVRRYG